MTTEPTTDFMEQAALVAAHRFAYADTTHPATAAMIALCTINSARALAVEEDVPDPGEPTEIQSQFPIQEVDPFHILRSEIALPSLPAVYQELQETIADESSSAQDVAEIISRDTGLSAFLLRLVNSAFYSFPSQIDTISRAVTVVGTTQLSTLAVGTTVMKLFTDIPDDLVNMQSFWRHSITTGILAREIAKRTKRPEPERYFVAGLLHDVGRLAMYGTIPNSCREVLTFARKHRIPLALAEDRILGFDHAMLGGMLLKKWNLPFPLVTSVLHHHAPQKSKYAPEATITHVANILAFAIDTGSTGEQYAQKLDETTWDKVGLTPQDLEELASDSAEQIASTIAALI